MHILDKIVNHKKKEVAERKALYPTNLLETSIYFRTECVSLVKYLTDENKSGVIAEFKRRSPSKGNINKYASVEKVTIGYMQAGASALSVLTDTEFFGGKSADLMEARKFNYCPILRKDFIVDEYQIIEAKSIGADAILLIAACLTPEEVKNLSSTAHSLGLQVLMEIHDASELDRFCENINVVGVNNRNLKTFEVSVKNSHTLLPLLPEGVTKISESGISDPKDAAGLLAAGFDGLLIGESFMKSSQPGIACLEFIEAIEKHKDAALMLW
ncbi:MAG: indole-3-glycerol phosphate synthase TrpC [Bacteroidota bacterium]